MDKLLKQALAMSKTKLRNKEWHYKDMSVAQRVSAHYKHNYEHYNELIEKHLKLSLIHI